MEPVTREMDYRGVLTEYRGYPILDMMDFAQPVDNADTLLIEASDGYAFLLSFEELQQNNNILIVQQGHGKNASFDVVGPESSKAWVRNTVKLTVIASDGLSITTPAGIEVEFNPDEWVAYMDSTQISLPEGTKNYKVFQCGW